MHTKSKTAHPNIRKPRPETPVLKELATGDTPQGVVAKAKGLRLRPTTATATATASTTTSTAAAATTTAASSPCYYSDNDICYESFRHCLCHSSSFTTSPLTHTPARAPV